MKIYSKNIVPTKKPVTLRILQDSGSSLKLRKEMTQLPKPLIMTQDSFSLDEETQLPLDIPMLPPEKVSYDVDDSDDDVSDNSLLYLVRG